MATLEGKVSLITGAGSGIGRAVAQLFAREGAKVVAVDINGDSAQETVRNLIGEDHYWYKADVTSSKEVSDLFNNVKALRIKVPSIYILCAGVASSKPILETEEGEFDKQVSVSLKGTFLMMKEGARSMIESNVIDGSIVTLSSMGAELFAADYGAYIAGKCGVLGLTKVAAKEWAAIPIRCNTLLPGFIDTPMYNSFPKEKTDAFTKAIPIGRLGSPSEVAEVCLFLASEKSSYITGSCLSINGGVV